MGELVSDADLGAGVFSNLSWMRSLSLSLILSLMGPASAWCEYVTANKTISTRERIRSDEDFDIENLYFVE